MSHWHIITPEFPPDIGGIADYTKQVAEGLIQAGDDVTVWAGGARAVTGDEAPYVRRDLSGWRISGLVCVWRKLDKYDAPRRLLVQWVPHGYGWRSMNLPFCFWVLLRACRGDHVELMIHEPFHSFAKGKFRQNVAAVVHRLMIISLLAATKRAWTSIPTWGVTVRKYQLRRKIRVEWLPVPSNLPVCDQREQIERAKESVDNGTKAIIGHFSTYGRHQQKVLSPVLVRLLKADRDRIVLLLGKNGTEFLHNFLQANPSFAGRVIAKGTLTHKQLSAYLAVCDVVIQPYPDGASSRRTTLMAALQHGVPIVTTQGTSTEDLWAASGAVALARTDEPEAMATAVEEVLANTEWRKALGTRGRSVYWQHFDVRKAVDRLRQQELSHAT